MSARSCELIAGKAAGNVVPEPEARGQTLAEALGELVGHAERGEPIVETLPCGLDLLDETAGGLVRGEFCGLVAAPGLGKSTIADLLVLNALRRRPGAVGLIFNLETSTAIRTARLVAGSAVKLNADGAIDSCIPLGPLLRGKLDAVDRLRDAAERMAGDVGVRLIFVDDASGAVEIADLIESESPDVVVIDHLGLVQAEGGSATEQTDNALSALHAALRKVNAAGLLIAEVNKLALAAEAIDLSGIRGSARFASLAGQMITIAREDNDESRDPVLVLRLLKSRHGPQYVEQRAQFFGGLGYVHFVPGIEPILKPKRKRGKATATDE